MGNATTTGKRAVLQQVREGYDMGDPYGSAVLAQFAVADLLQAVDPGAIPSAWEYSPGIGAAGSLATYVDYLQEEGDLAAADIADLYCDGIVTVADLVAAGNVLARHAARADAAGRAY